MLKERPCRAVKTHLPSAKSLGAVCGSYGPIISDPKLKDASTCTRCRAYVGLPPLLLPTIATVRAVVDAQVEDLSGLGALALREALLALRQYGEYKVRGKRLAYETELRIMNLLSGKP